MADVEHVDIASANAHEPKHITLASTGDTGKVITSSSVTASISEFRLLTPFELDKTLQHTIQLLLKNNAVILATTGASIYSTGSYNDITLLIEDTLSPKRGFDFNSGTGFITVNQTGLYRVSVSMSVSTSVITNVGLAMAVDGDFFSTNLPPVTAALPATGDMHVLASSFEVNLTLAEVVNFGLAASVTSNLTIHDAVVSIRRVE